MIATLLCLQLVSEPVSPPPGDAPSEDSADPTDHAQRGLEAYEAQDWDEAARQFEAAHAADPDPQYVYAQANALRRAGRCAEAIPRYRVFLGTGPEGNTELAAQQNLARCEAQLDAEADPPESAPHPVVPVLPPAVAVVPARSDRAPTPLVRDPWAHALTWPGVAIAGVGAGLLGEAHVRRGRADRADDELAYRDALAGAPVLSRAGIGLLATGAALVVAGIVRWSILAARRRRATAALPRWLPLASGASRRVR